jgi:hypothetical protein
MGGLKGGKGAAIQKKKQRAVSAGQDYAVDAGSSEKGVEQSNKLISSEQKNRKVGKTDMAGQLKGKRIRGRSDQRRAQVMSAIAAPERIMGSSGKNLGS